MKHSECSRPVGLESVMSEHAGCEISGLRRLISKDLRPWVTVLSCRTRGSYLAVTRLAGLNVGKTITYWYLPSQTSRHAPLRMQVSTRALSCTALTTTTGICGNFSFMRRSKVYQSIGQLSISVRRRSNSSPEASIARASRPLSTARH